MGHLKDAYTFLHDANSRNDGRVLEVRAKHGLEGYGFFFALIEMMRESTNYKLSCKLANGYALQLGISTERFNDLLTACVAADELLVVENDEIFSRSFLRRMQKYDDKRGKLKANALQLHSKSKPKGKQKVPICKADALQMKEQEQEQKQEQKQGEPEGEPLPPHCPPLPPKLDTAAVRSALASWADYKTKRGEKYKSAHGWSEILNTFSQLGSQALCDAVASSMRSNYAGLFPTKPAAPAAVDAKQARPSAPPRFVAPPKPPEPSEDARKAAAAMVAKLCGATADEVSK